MRQLLKRLTVLTVIVFTATAWSLAQDKAASSQQDANSPAAAQFDQLKKLIGEWTGTLVGEDGEKHEADISYRLTANGSTLVETLFAGTSHEMLTMYHRDGDRLLLTHYCAAGNQPRMRAAPSADPNSIAFKFLDGTNLDPSKDMHMHDATIKFVSEDHVQSEWTHWVKGKAAGSARFELQRKKK